MVVTQELNCYFASSTQLISQGQVKLHQAQIRRLLGQGIVVVSIAAGIGNSSRCGLVEVVGEQMEASTPGHCIDTTANGGKESLSHT